MNLRTVSILFVEVMLFILFCAAIGLLAFEANRKELPRIDLPAFNTPSIPFNEQQQRKLEQELFEEIAHWHETSLRYPSQNAPSLRALRWAEMSKQGFELAHITLQVLDPARGHTHPLAEPLNRLNVLAEQGHTGAMCLMIDLVDKSTRPAERANFLPLALRWLTKGAELGHPECLLQLGRRQLLGIDGVLLNTAQGIQHEMMARKMGYAHDLDALISHLQKQWTLDAQKFTQLYCWMSIDAKYIQQGGPKRLLSEMHTEAIKRNDPSLLSLTDQLPQRKFDLQTCVSMSAS